MLEIQISSLEMESKYPVHLFTGGFFVGFFVCLTVAVPTSSSVLSPLIFALHQYKTVELFLP